MLTGRWVGGCCLFLLPYIATVDVPCAITRLRAMRCKWTERYKYLLVSRLYCHAGTDHLPAHWVRLWSCHDPRVHLRRYRSISILDLFLTSSELFFFALRRDSGRIDVDPQQRCIYRATLHVMPWLETGPRWFIHRRSQRGPERPRPPANEKKIYQS